MGSLYIFGIPIYEDSKAADKRREDKEDRKEIRQDGKTDRTEARQEGHTDRVDSRTERVGIRYEDGSGPLADLGNALRGAGEALGVVSPAQAYGAAGGMDPMMAGGLLVVVLGGVYLLTKD